MLRGGKCNLWISLCIKSYETSWLRKLNPSLWTSPTHKRMKPQPCSGERKVFLWPPWGTHVTHRIQRCLPCAQLLSAADHSSPFSGLSKMSQRNHFASNHRRTSGHGQWPIVKQSACSGSQPSLTRQRVVGDLTAHALPGNSYSTDTYLFGYPWRVSRAQAEPVLLPEEKR